MVQETCGFSSGENVYVQAGDVMNFNSSIKIDRVSLSSTNTATELLYCFVNYYSGNFESIEVFMYDFKLVQFFLVVLI